MIHLIEPRLNKFKTMGELKNCVLSKKNEDVKVRIGDMAIQDEKFLVAGTEYKMRANGMRDILKKINMPASFAQNIPHDLFVDVFNRLAQKTYGDFEGVLRVQDGEVRALVPDSFVPLDSTELINRVSRWETPSLVASALTYDGDNIKTSFTTTATVTAKDKGDITNLGITAATSDCGLTPLETSSFMFRLVCTNGLVLPTKMSGGISLNPKKVNSETAWDLFSSSYDRIMSNLVNVKSDFLINLGNKKLDTPAFIKIKDEVSKAIGGRKANQVMGSMEHDIVENKAEFSVFDAIQLLTSTARDSVSILDARGLEMAAGELSLLYGASNS